ncbi:MAG: site-specific integrase [Sulfuricella denitrificans]|nr:site-specific integrase [Sulfuricella denitrificans]
MPIHQLPNGKFRVQIRRKGYPEYDKTHDTRLQAEDAEARILASRVLHKDAEMTLTEGWKKYSASAMFTQKTENTRKTEISRIKSVLAELGGYSFRNLSRDTGPIYDYIDMRSVTMSKRTGRKLSWTAVRLEIAALSSLVAWAKDRKMLAANFVSGIQRGKTAKRKRRVPPVEQAALQNAILTFDAPNLAEAARFAKLLLNLGCRPGELSGLLLADIRLNDRSLTFKMTKSDQEDRFVHITPEAMQTMKAQVRYANEQTPGSLYLFSTRSSKGDWVKYNYSYGIKRLRMEGVLPKDFHAHAMRREFVSRAIESGLTYATIGKQTGHHSTQAIEIYDEGLVTAPEIRAALDGFASKVSDEELMGHFKNMGASEATLQKLKADMEGRPVGMRGLTVEMPSTQPKQDIQPKKHKKKQGKRRGR